MRMSNAAEQCVKKTEADLETEKEAERGGPEQDVCDGPGQAQGWWDAESDSDAVVGDGDGQVGEQGLREQAPGQEAGAGKERNDAGHEEEGSQVRVGKVEGFEIGHLMVLGDRRARGMLFSGSYRCPE